MAASWRGCDVVGCQGRGAFRAHARPAKQTDYVSFVLSVPPQGLPATTHRGRRLSDWLAQTLQELPAGSEEEPVLTVAPRL